MTDTSIIKLFFDRNGDAIAEVEDKYGASMKRYARKCLSDSRDAEEVYMDALQALWSSIPPEVPKKLGAYAMQVLKNKVVDKVRYVASRKRSEQKEVLTAELFEVGATASAEDEITGDHSGVIERFLKSEPEMSRIVFVKRYWFGKSINEIAIETSMSANAVSTRLSRTRERLRRHLIEEGVMTE